MAAGELATQNYRSIQALSQLSESFSRRAEVNDIVNELMETNTQEIKKLYEWSTPLELSSKLQQLQVDITNRVQVVETTLPMKIDRSDLASLDALASRLRAYDAFRDNTEFSLQELSSSLTLVSDLASKHSSHLNRIDTDFEIVHESLALKAPIHELSATNKQLNINTMLIESLGNELSHMVSHTLRLTLSSINIHDTFIMTANRCKPRCVSMSQTLNAWMNLSRSILILY
jgi:hypothetical protein